MTGPDTPNEDQRFCHEILAEVSRSFVLPISRLPDPLRDAAACGYLLCRISDTIEDAAALTPEERSGTLGAWLQAVRGDTGRWCGLRAALPGRDAERRLLRESDRVLRVFRDLPRAMQEAMEPWIAEMIHGMRLYAERPPRDGLRQIESLGDLDRYCFFVAGTVGHMLTELFLSATDLSDSTIGALRSRAEDFGLGLQFVNILKDVSDDLERGWCYVPRDLCRARGVTPRSLVDPEHIDAAHATVRPLFDVARSRMDVAMTYTLAVPAAMSGIREFCLLPIFMAARTLCHTRRHPDLFTPGVRVRISRDEVTALVAQCLEVAGDDSSARRAYAGLWDGWDQPSTSARSASGSASDAKT